MFIFCRGEVAKIPYKMPVTGRYVYSLEELCYDIYNNIYTINAEFFTRELITWLREETKHAKLAKKLNNLLDSKPKLKDLVVTIFCGCDYYKEEEILEVINVLDEISNLPLYKRKKLQADNHLRAGKYNKCLKEYSSLIEGPLALNLSTEEFGNIIHNQGIAHFYISSFEQAKRDFKEAYSRNGDEDSLKHYLFIYLLQKDQDGYEREIESYGLSQLKGKEIKEEYQRIYEEVQNEDFEDYDIDDFTVGKITIEEDIKDPLELINKCKVKNIEIGPLWTRKKDRKD